MSRMVDRLRKAQDLAWAGLKPAFALAIIQAEQADYEASRGANLAQCSVQPAYPPLVVALSESVAE
jgi:hypothetical protein